MESIIPKTVTEYDLRLLRIFKVVVENGGFAAAESELRITRSTISVHMSNLEARMKLKLCLRGRSGFSLTEDGQTVYHAALKLFDSIDDFSLTVNTLGKDLSGEIVLLCSDLIDSSLQEKMTKVIAYINQEAPNLHVVLDRDTIPNIEKQLLKDKAHIGIFPSYNPMEGINYHELQSEPMYLCCAKKHDFFEVRDQDISEEMLGKTKAIHPGIDIDVRGRNQLKRLNLSAKAYQFDTRKALILSGCYIGYLPQSHVQEELNNSKVRFIQPESLTYPFVLSMATKKQPRENAKISLLMNAFTHVFGAFS